MRILYISQYYPPEMGAPSARVSELARHWVLAGHQVTVLTGFPNHPTGEVHPDYRGKIWRLICREQDQGVQVVRTWLAPFPNRKPLERILNYSSFLFSACISGSFLKRPDVVIATSPQLLVGLAGWYLGKIKRAPFIFEVRDLWPESITASGVGSGESGMIRILQSIANFLYRKAQKIVVVTPAFKDDLVEKQQLSPEKISIITNGVETELFSPQGEGDFFGAEYADRFIVSYIGTMGMAHALESVVETAALLAEELPQVSFFLVGAGAEQENLRALIAQRRLGNIHLLPSQPRELIPRLIRSTDVSLVHLRRTEVFKTVIPSKMLEFMSCASPLILGVDGQARRILEQADSGIYVEPENPAAMAAAITALYHDPQRRSRLGENGRRFIVEAMSRQRTAVDYLAVLEELRS